MMASAKRPVALITGSAKRIGAQIARKLCAGGFDLILHERTSSADMTALIEELTHSNEVQIECVRGDLDDRATINNLAACAQQSFGRLAALVHNASSFYPTKLESSIDTPGDELMGANARAPYFLTQACVELLRENRGCVVNLVDIYARRPLIKHSIYCMAKAANAMMVKSLALELAPDIRVNGVAPGAILWPDAGKPTAQQEAIIAQTALQRCGEPDDIAAAVLWLIQDARYLTGQVINVDGGRLLHL